LSQPPFPTTPRRRSRGPVVVLVVLAAVLAVGLGGLVAVVTADDGGADLDTSGEPSPTSSPTEPAPEEPERIRLGSNDYVSPCRLLTPKDVTRIFGRLGPDGYVDQVFHDESMSEKQLRRETDTVTAAVETSCDYVYGDQDITSLKVQVNHYRTAKRARAEWASIAYLGTGKESEKLAKDTYGDGFGFVVQLARENEANLGGDPVAGARRSLLYVAGRQAFVSYGSNVVVTLHYGRNIDVFLDEPLTAGEYRFQAPRMVKAAAVIKRRLAQRDLDQSPLPAYIGDESSYADGVPYLDACELLDAEAFEELVGETPDPGAESTSLPANPEARRRRNATLSSQTGSNSCARDAYRNNKNGIGGRSYHADLEVRYAPTATAPAVLEQHVIQKYYDEKDEASGRLDTLVAQGFMSAQRESTADLFYLFDSTPQTGRRDRFVTAFFTVGPYLFVLEGSVPQGEFDFKPPPLPRYRQAVDLVVANVDTLLTELENTAD
jgi:hypothetical protein